MTLDDVKQEWREKITKLRDDLEYYRHMYAADQERITALESAATDFSQITRLEVIDGNGRAYVAWDVTVTPSVQDDGRTLKLFVEGDRTLATAATK